MQVIIHRKYYNTATSWNELSAKQLIMAMQVIYSGKEPYTVQLQLLRIITGMNWWQFFWAPIDELNDALYLTLFLLKPAELTKTILAKYKGLVGPADDFNSITGAEFTHADFYFHQYLENNDPESLDALVGILYRYPRENYDHKINPAGDTREPFNGNIIHYYRDNVRQWPLAAKRAVLAWYHGCRMKMISQNPQVYSGGGGEEPLHGMWSIMRGIAEKGNHGNFKDVEQLPIHEIMMELNEISTEAARLEQLQKQQPQTKND